MKVRTLLVQTAHTLGSMAGNQGLQIAAGIALSRVYGPAGKGLVTYAGIAILGVIAIADGLGSAIAGQCGKDPAQVPASYAAALRIILVISAIAVVPLMITGLYFPSQRALLYVGIAFPFALYAQTISGFHLIALRIGRTNLASLVINAGAALAMLLAILLAQPKIDAIMAIWTAGYIGGAAIIYQGMGRMRAAKHDFEASLAVQVRFAARASSASLMTFLASRIDVFIVSATLSAAALGNYTLALAFGELMWQVGRAISWSAYGRVATATFARAANLAAKVTRIVIAAELVAGILGLTVGPALLTVVYGPAFSDAGSVLRILMPGMTLYAGDAILTYFLSVKVGRAGAILRIEAATLIACATGSLLSVRHYGMMGPAITTTLAYVFSFSVKSILFVRATSISAKDLLVLKRSDFRRSEAEVDLTERVIA